MEECGAHVDTQIARPHFLARVVGREAWEDIVGVQFLATERFIDGHDPNEFQIPQIDDATISAIASLTRLRTLEIEHAPVSGSALRTLARARSLRSLILRGMNVTDQDMASIGSISGLEILEVQGAPITDAAVPKIAIMYSLKRLNVKGTVISDKGIAQLAAIPHLQSLCVRDSQVSLSGARLFAKKRPNCRVDIVEDPVGPLP